MPRNRFLQSIKAFLLETKTIFLLQRQNVVQGVQIWPQFQTHTKFGKMLYPWKKKEIYITADSVEYLFEIIWLVHTHIIP